jgi:hypothetical protein
MSTIRSRITFTPRRSPMRWIAPLAVALCAGLFLHGRGAGEAEAGAPGGAAADAYLGSALDFRLKQVLISPFGDSRRATLDIGIAVRTFDQGDEVIPGVRLAEVSSDRVVLARGQRRDVLMLDAKPVVTPPAAAPPAAAAAARTPDSAWGALASHGGGVIVQSPPMEGIGRALDLLQNDRIVRINGTAVTQASEVQALVSRLAPDAALQIDGVRDGKPIRLVYSSAREPTKDNTAPDDE